MASFSFSLFSESFKSFVLNVDHGTGMTVMKEFVNGELHTARHGVD